MRLSTFFAVAALAATANAIVETGSILKTDKRTCALQSGSGSVSPGELCLPNFAIVSGMAPDVPRQWGTYFNRYVNRITDLAKYYVFTDATGSPLANSSNYPSLYENYGQTYTVVGTNEYF
ncbi:hypothetical protein V1509DRAFT_624415 [Lipomyces kononenkoae]